MEIFYREFVSGSSQSLFWVDETDYSWKIGISFSILQYCASHSRLLCFMFGIRDAGGSWSMPTYCTYKLILCSNWFLIENNSKSTAPVNNGLDAIRTSFHGPTVRTCSVTVVECDLFGEVN